MARKAFLSGNKSGREAWEDCEDVEELKAHLGRQQQQFHKLGKENAELRKTIKVVEGQAPEESPEELEATLKKIRKSIASNIGSQMVYRKQANMSCVSADFPNLTLPQVCDIRTYQALIKYCAETCGQT